MKKILALIDFTDISLLAMQQAIALAKGNGGSVHLLHIGAEGADVDDLKSQLSEFSGASEDLNLHVSTGDFRAEVMAAVQRLRADLVVVGTHGKSGWKQHLLGSNIYRLTKDLSCPVLVVNEKFKPSSSGFENVLIPVSHHANFVKKVKNAAATIREGGQLQIFAIVKPGVDLGEAIEDNIRNASDWLDAEGVNWTLTEVDSSSFSVGYSRETLKYAKQNGIACISIFTEVSQENSAFGAVDKENMLLNGEGIAILCSN